VGGSGGRRAPTQPRDTADKRLGTADVGRMAPLFVPFIYLKIRKIFRKFQGILRLIAAIGVLVRTGFVALQVEPATLESKCKVPFFSLIIVRLKR
jgi:hypothetical protein